MEWLSWQAGLKTNKIMEVEECKMQTSLILMEVKALLEAQKKVAIYVRGGSMRPFLRDGDKVVLIPANIRNVKEGMIVLAQTSLGTVLHRVVSINSERVLLRGDANLCQLEQANIENIWGIVSDAYRKENELNLYSYRMYVAIRIWNWLRPLRGGLLLINDWWYKKNGI